ncbi:MAG TPA: M14 family metallopeptidase [Thermoanaerobaculia bacterium]|nr:M14 family metallopeptidase [Thermoanaerobaculia bacterium]
MRTKALLSCTLLLAAHAWAAAPVAIPPLHEVLPPPLEWSGTSEKLVVPASDPWITPAERTELRRTPDYEETVAWLRRLVSASPELRMVSLGKSPQGRDIWMVIASRERHFTPSDIHRSGKPVVLAQAGIHSGEIDGKDAGLMLLRDMTVRGTKSSLLEGATLLFVPIFNVDGHERSSPWSRINQRGPEISGWRVNSRNLNLNRDYMKADTPEMRAMITALRVWNPDLYIDLHVTDGADYQYDITWGANGIHGWSPATAAWLERTLSPRIHSALAGEGHIPGPLVFAEENLTKGMIGGNFSPRFSNGYGDARHIPSIIVENHSLKPYRQRVLGTYVLLESALKTVASERASLKAAITADRQRRPATIALSWVAGPDDVTAIDFLGVDSRERLSPISGSLVTEWLGRPVPLRIQYTVPTQVEHAVSRPAAYWIPPAWDQIAAGLELHGVRFERIAEPRTLEVEAYRLTGSSLEPRPFEGRARVTAAAAPEKRRMTLPANSIRVPADQPLGTLAALMLEPLSPDSYFQWGFILEPLSRTEYAEAYVMEPMAARMLEDPELAREFMEKLRNDATFAASPRERLQWFYEKTPYFDEQWMLYPIVRELP